MQCVFEKEREREREVKREDKRRHIHHNLSWCIHVASLYTVICVSVGGGGGCWKAPGSCS